VTDSETQPSFDKFDFSEKIDRALAEQGFINPTPVQEQAIPIMSSGDDMVVTAQTGTGKTAAFLLPILQKLKPSGAPEIEALILSPTRELALQIGQHLSMLAKYTGHRHTVVYGGSSVKKGRETLLKGAQIIVATPGRLLDYMRQGVISLSKTRIVVLDEADRMLDMGFMPDVRRILRKTPRGRQTALFSATFPEPIAYLAQEFLRNPARIAIGMVAAPAEGITQRVFPCDPQKKIGLLKVLLKSYDWDSALIFTRTKRQADAIARQLKSLKYSIGIIHGDRSQPQRLQALEGFKKGRYKILVATNVAARGLDISGITHVLNVDTPDVADDYIHRIGRTARYDATGDALTIVSPEEYEHLLAIEAVLGYKIEREEIEGFAVDIECLYSQTHSQPFVKKPPVYFGYQPDAIPEGAVAAGDESTSSDSNSDSDTSETLNENGESAEDDESSQPSFGRRRTASTRKRRL
jgi:ATP-dependent RNA helicase RhlE